MNNELTLKLYGITDVSGWHICQYSGKDIAGCNLYSAKGGVHLCSERQERTVECYGSELYNFCAMVLCMHAHI